MSAFLREQSQHDLPCIGSVAGTRFLLRYKRHRETLEDELHVGWVGEGRKSFNSCGCKYKGLGGLLAHCESVLRGGRDDEDDDDDDGGKVRLHIALRNAVEDKMGAGAVEETRQRNFAAAKRAVHARSRRQLATALSLQHAQGVPVGVPVAREEWEL